MRLEGLPVDVVVVVVEPTAKSLEVGRRAADLVREGSLGRLMVTANRVRDEDDVARVTAALPGVDVVIVPEDAAIVDAERQGAAPHVAPHAPGTRALVGLAERLLAMTPPALEPPAWRRALPLG